MGEHKDIHVLNWGSIVKNSVAADGGYPCQKREKEQNKGILFEDLVEKLLVAMFPEESWRRTIESHDGKRDFAYPDDECLPDQKWAECKNYHSNISLNVIAPTLIMSAIENINTLLFFSYSPLNDNAVDGILRYAETTKKTIRLFDGNLLESLICKYNKVMGIGTFFPETDFDLAYKTLEEKPLRVIKTVQDVHGNRLSTSHLFEVGEPVILHIIVQNLSLERISYNISATFSPPMQSDRFEQRHSLPYAGISEHTISCRTLMAGSLRYTATLEAEKEGSGATFSKSISGRFKVSDEPYLFWSGRQALDAQRTTMEHLASYRAAPLFITAKSGCGKSTLIELLLSEKELRRKYSILLFNIEFSRSACAKNLLSQILGIHDTGAAPLEQEKEARDVLAVLSSEYVESAEMLAGAMLGLYQANRPFLIVIDDVQKLNRAYADLIQELDYQARQLNCPIYYLFALNENEAGMDEILTRLSWDASYQNREYEAIRLDGFNGEDILAFLRHKFGLAGIERYFAGFDETIRPIELHNFCTILKQNHIIAPTCLNGKRRQTYQIVDGFRFAEAVNLSLYANRSLKEIYGAFAKDDTSLFVLKYLYLAEDIPPELLGKYRKQINNFISLGVLRETGGRLMFRHEEMRKTAGETLVFSDEDYADIYYAGGTPPTAKAVCALKLLGKLRNGTVFLRGFFRATVEIENLRQRYELCCLIMTRLSDLAEFKLTVDALRFVRFQFDLLDKEQGYAVSLRFLEKTARAALSPVWDEDCESVETMAYFIKKYFDRSITTRTYAPCMDIFPKFEAAFKMVCHISDARRNYWMAHYMNRMAIIYDRGSIPLASSPPQAEACYAEAADFCEKAGAPADLIFQLCVDEFNRHYVYRHDLTPEYTMRTYEELSGIKRREQFSSASLSYHLLLLEYLRQNDGSMPWEPEALLDRVGRALQSSSSPFYALKLHMLEIYILTALDRFSEAAPVLIDACELAYRKGLRYSVYKLTYVDAWLHFFQGGTRASEETRRLFVLALEQMLGAYGGSYGSLARETYLIARLVEAAGLNDPARLLPFVDQRSGEVQALLKAVCEGPADNDDLQRSLLKMHSYFMYHEIDFPII